MGLQWRCAKLNIHFLRLSFLHVFKERLSVVSFSCCAILYDSSQKCFPLKVTRRMFPNTWLVAIVSAPGWHWLYSYWMKTATCKHTQRRILDTLHWLVWRYTLFCLCWSNTLMQQANGHGLKRTVSQCFLCEIHSLTLLELWIAISFCLSRMGFEWVTLWHKHLFDLKGK